MTNKEFDKYTLKIHEEYLLRSSINWILDISLIKEYIDV